MYIRFESDILFEESQCKKGIFAAMGDLKRMNVMSEAELNWYECESHWFNKNLPNPACFTLPIAQTISKHAISWFSVDAIGFVGRTLCIVKLFEKYGISMNKLESNDPGKIIYKDEYQIVVIPYCSNEET